MRISDWSSDVCSSDLGLRPRTAHRYPDAPLTTLLTRAGNSDFGAAPFDLQPFRRQDAQAFQPLDVAGALHLHHADLVAHDDWAVLGHAKHPNLVEDARRVDLARVLGDGPQTKHVPFASENRQRIPTD